MSTVTKPIALDETLQGTNTALGSLGKDTTLQAIASAIANVGLSNIGNLSSLATTDKTSLVSAINEVVGEVSDLDTDKADKVASATNGNLAGLNGSGNLTDSGWASDKTTTSASGNPISITGLKSNQLAVNPVITFEPIQAGSGDPSPSNVRAISGYDKIEVLSCGKNLCDNSKNKVGGYYNLTGQWIEGSGYASTGLIPVVPNTQYRGHIYDKNGNALNDIVWTEWSNETTCEGQVTDAYITTGANTRFVRLRNYSNESSYITNNNFLFALEKGNTSSTTYPAYHKTTDLSEPLPQTVYGGQEIVRTGVLTSTMTNVDLSTLSWTYVSNYNCWRAVLSVAKVSSNDSPINGKADRYVIVKAEGYVQSHNSNTLAVSTSDYIFIDNGSTTTSPIGQLVCELKTPIEIQLTPHEISLLKDYAYVSTNGTNIALDYHNGEIATLGDVEQLSQVVENSNQYFKDTYGFKCGVFIVSVTANTRKAISTSADIVDGTLPKNFVNCIFNVRAANQNMPNSALIMYNKSGGIDTIVIYTDATNSRLSINWIEFP